MIKKSIFSAYIIMFLIIPCIADVGGYEVNGSGGAVFPVKNNAITMTKEIVNINVYPDLDNFYWYRVEYDCLFYLKNTVTKNQNVLVGFPDRHYVIKDTTYPTVDEEGNESYTEVGKSQIQDFKFIVDGNEVQYKKYPGDVNSSFTEVPKYATVYTTEISFAPEEQKSIKNTFTMYVQNYTPYPCTMFSSTELDTNSIKYILLTARTWKGSIGEADIYITFYDIPMDFLKINEKLPYYNEKINPSRVHYHFTDYYPETDINVNFGLKHLPMEEALACIDDYFKKGEFKNVIASFRILHHNIFYSDEWKQIESKYDNRFINITDEKEMKKTWDLIRKKAYFMAGELYLKAIEKAIELYYIAFRYTYQTGKIDVCFTDFYPGKFPDKSESYLFNTWVHEGEQHAPCYYIAYNLACAYSITKNYQLSEKWLNTAFEMKSSLKKMAETDKDLENYRTWKKPLTKTSHQ